MNKARLKLTWVPSVTQNATYQQLEVFTEEDNAPEKIQDERLETSESSKFITGMHAAGAVITAKVTTYNGFGLSSHAVTEFVVPDLSSPQPATGLGVEVAEVVDDDPPPETEPPVE